MAYVCDMACYANCHVGSVVITLIPCNWFWLRADEQLEDRFVKIGCLFGL